MPPAQRPEVRAVGLNDQEPSLGRRRALGPPVTLGRALGVDLAFWTLFGALTASNWLLSPFAEQFPYPWRLIGKAFFISYLWALFTPAVFWLAQRFNPEHGAPFRRALVLLACAPVFGLAAAAGQSLFSLWLIVPVLGGPPNPHFQLWPLIRGSFFNEVVTFVVVLGAAFAVDIFRRYRAGEREAARLHAQASQLQAERAELRAQAARLQAQSAELNAQLARARLDALRTQLNPHFLFNTLNAVSALVSEDPRGVRSMIALLGELLRYTLRDAQEQEIPVREELRLLRLYLEILEIRYQGQLETVVQVDPDVETALVPALILQPLVENAVKHAIDPAGGFGTIEVRAERAADGLLLSVRDTGSGNETAPAGGNQGGVGLRLIRERLSELYGGEESLELVPAPRGGTIARIVLPYHTQAYLHAVDEPARASGR